ncbi:hypothetical protein CD928_05730 [Sphingopyxis sp. GW247-27LB]|nr:hypothetical protein CD928_05730 [Sphingopyxis sp. GW247-27LB]
MKERRERQLDRVEGFTPIANRRIGAAISGQKALIAVAQANVLPALRKTVAEIEIEATDHVRRMLPKARMARSLVVRPSKSDNPAYRKTVITGPRRFVAL